MAFAPESKGLRAVSCGVVPSAFFARSWRTHSVIFIAMICAPVSLRPRFVSCVSMPLVAPLQAFALV